MNLERSESCSKARNFCNKDRLHNDQVGFFRRLSFFSECLMIMMIFFFKTQGHENLHCRPSSSWVVNFLIHDAYFVIKKIRFFFLPLQSLASFISFSFNLLWCFYCIIKKNFLGGFVFHTIISLPYYKAMQFTNTTGLKKTQSRIIV